MIKPERQLSELRQRLGKIFQEMGRVLPIFLGRERLLKAYLRYQPRTCGNPGCKCARGERHGAWIVQIPEGRGSRCRSVSRGSFEALLGPADAYRRWREARARWNRLAREANAALGEIERQGRMDVDAALEELCGKSER